MTERCELPKMEAHTLVPDFLILGAEKAGTTWLADMLRQHPEIFIPPEKELFYFNKQFFESPELHNYNYDQPLSWYLNFFRDAQPGQVIGEASPAYLWDEAAPEKISGLKSTIRLIAILRDPVQRAHSQYLYFLQRGYFGRITFEEALVKRSDMLTRGLYALQLERFLALFPGDQIYLGFFDDLMTDSAGFLGAVQEFIGVDRWIPDNLEQRSNVTGLPRFHWINRVISQLRYPLRKHNPDWLMRILRGSGLAALQERIRLANTQTFEKRPQIAPETDQRLREYFREDISRVEVLTGRDLSKWKMSETAETGS